MRISIGKAKEEICSTVSAEIESDKNWRCKQIWVTKYFKAVKINAADSLCRAVMTIVTAED